MRLLLLACLLVSTSALACASEPDVQIADGGADQAPVVATVEEPDVPAVADVQVEPEPVAPNDPPSFDVFIGKFCSDQAYRLDHVQWPLEVETMNPDTGEDMTLRHNRGDDVYALDMLDAYYCADAGDGTDAVDVDLVGVGENARTLRMIGRASDISGSYRFESRATTGSW